MKHLIFIVLSILALTGCSTKSTTGSSSNPTNDSIKNIRTDPVVIDITKTPEKILVLEDIVNIEYIPLETNDSTLVNRPRPDIVSERYIIYRNDNGQILVFNRKGKSLYSFNRRGGGPEEYTNIYHIILDEKRKYYLLNIFIKLNFSFIQLIGNLSVV
ncbi:6-bladed beta-propeller [Bacteroides bouchesdurhonensis]